MKRVHLEAADDHVKQLAHERDPIGAVRELVWNSLDAEATVVDVEIVQSAIEGVDRVRVVDNGHGMPAELCVKYFDRIGGSWKKQALKSANLDRPLHGKFGHGRLRGYALGSFLRWITVADATTGRFRTTISARDTARNDFEISDPEPTSEGSGTCFEAWGKQDASLNQLLDEKARQKLVVAFAPYLINFHDVQIAYDGQRLDPQAAIDRTSEYEVGFQADGQPVAASLTIIEWATKVDRDIYLCDTDGLPLHVVDAGIQAPGFDFTAYATWPNMAEHLDTFLFDDAETPAGALLYAVRDKLREHFKLRTFERRRELVVLGHEVGDSHRRLIGGRPPSAV